MCIIVALLKFKDLGSRFQRFRVKKILNFGGANYSVVEYLPQRKLT